MVREQNLTLAHPAVQAVKARWDANERYRHFNHGLTFEDFFELFKTRHSMNAISQKDCAGCITRARVHQIYNKYFRELFEGQSGRDRLSACTFKKRLVRVKETKDKLFKNPAIKDIARRARNAGCKVKAIPRMERGKPSGFVEIRTLLINGHKCSVHHISDYRRIGKAQRLYVQIALSHSVLCDTYVSIVYVTVSGFPKRIFVLLNSLLLQAYFTHSGPKRYTFYFPVEHLPVYNNIRPKLDAWEYEGAWDLLQPKT